eukprot:2383956-Amphidinium_carterae.1
MKLLLELEVVELDVCTSKSSLCWSLMSVSWTKLVLELEVVELELEVTELDVSAMLDGVDREADACNLSEVEVNPVANTAAIRITRGEQASILCMRGA